MSERLTHLANLNDPNDPDDLVPLCGESGEVIAWARAHAPHDHAFNCFKCYRIMTGGRRHADPPSSARESQ